MIGLGDIAEKAYLPVLAAQPALDLCTRNSARLNRFGDVCGGPRPAAHRR
ncbi:hypothetical protein ACFSKW_38365 [Nonomuraea mangrovi]|uniref:Uncharacterized protein n=1 Tax=Nonomuraea mangrovi TaxID=2316207 RepID=A0ABW4T8A9_9ACTN